MSDRRQLKLPTEPGSLAFRIAAECPKCGEALKLTRLTSESIGYLECPILKCGFVEPRDKILVKLMEVILQQGSKIVKLGGNIIEDRDG